jgi:feruloyl-CoA synthase
MLGGYVSGTAIAPISVAYSTLSRDFEKLRHIVDVLRPGRVFVETPEPFERALTSGVLQGVPVLTGSDLREAMRAPATDALREREATIDADTVAKVLFTSGSTGTPKGVLNTHGMLTANQQMIAQLWPFLEHEPPIIVDWLPWSHTFGGNHNFNMILRHAGTLLIDEGRPRPDALGPSLRNLKEVPPTLYFNVPAGYAALLPHLEQDDELRDAFFRRLQVIFYAAASLPEDIWQRLSALAEMSGRGDVFMTTAWGATETSPLVTSAHFPLQRAGNIGVPAPGVELKLVPQGGKLEARVRGPNVMSEYLREPELTQAAFDEEGFYRIGDALKFVDDDHPELGLLFDGRVAEDFKLTTGSWVSVGALRNALLSCTSPALQDLVITGHDADFVGVLAWPDPARCAAVVGSELPIGELCDDPRLRGHLQRCIEEWNASHPGRSTRIRRLLLLREPPSIDAGEITDKGYINQSAVLGRRTVEVERVMRPSPTEDVLSFADAG